MIKFQNDLIVLACDSKNMYISVGLKTTGTGNRKSLEKSLIKTANVYVLSFFIFFKLSNFFIRNNLFLCTYLPLPLTKFLPLLSGSGSSFSCSLNSFCSA